MTGVLDYKGGGRMKGTHRRIEYDAERAPCGAAGGLRPVYLRGCYDQPEDRWPALTDCLTSRVTPRTLRIWEPLATKAPAPPKARPHCCYIQTVIFYHAPYIVWPFQKRYWVRGRLHACRGGFLEWDQVQSALTWDDIVEFEGDQFDVAGGSVVWAGCRWWMLHGARRREVRP